MTVRIELSPEDATMLLEVLTVYLTDFRREVAGTENPGFRRTLQRKQGFLERFVDELSRQSATSAGP